MKRPTALETLRKLRAYALEREEHKLAQRQADENRKRQECENSYRDLMNSYEHTVGDSTGFSYLRRDQCVREAGNRNIMDMRQFALVQRAKVAQIHVTLEAKQKVDMIDRVIEARRKVEALEQEALEQKRMDDIGQTLFFHQNHATFR